MWPLVAHRYAATPHPPFLLLDPQPCLANSMNPASLSGQAHSRPESTQRNDALCEEGGKMEAAMDAELGLYDMRQRHRTRYPVASPLQPERRGLTFGPSPLQTMRRAG
ncbi:hypothetical protein GALMADRAFT_496806 [Galerina marginata CBS 339.88]|uniref:Uncharacterized protein n=1 Tax=Galerina marginata (strain CBS 339.88) TaxID=685588 RepID=A0A067SXM1_GALM3|nr:hypothetical protein GALMADRAFT_496806 [Galerina marginata CBS 339.88]